MTAKTKKCGGQPAHSPLVAECGKTRNHPRHQYTKENR